MAMPMAKVKRLQQQGCPHRKWRWLTLTHLVATLATHCFLPRQTLLKMAAEAVEKQQWIPQVPEHDADVRGANASKRG